MKAVSYGAADERVVTLLRRVDSSSLRALVGSSILKAIESEFPTETERMIAEVLVRKCGKGLLSVKDIRLALIDLLEPGKARELAQSCGINATTTPAAYEGLGRVYRRGQHSRLILLAEALGLGPSYYPVAHEDERTAVVDIVGAGAEVALRPYLHAYQKRVKDQLVSRLGHPGQRIMVQMPTGSGKTYTALEAVVDILRRPSHHGFVLWLVDRNELLEQALGSFCALWNLKGDHSTKAYRFFAHFEPTLSSDQGVIFAGFDKVNSVLRDRHHAARDYLDRLIANTVLVVVDEAHTSVAETYEDCIRAFTSANNASLIGLTATPGRSSEESMDNLVRLYSRVKVGITDDSGKEIDDPIRYLQREGYLALLNTEVLETGLAFRGGTSQKDEERLLECLACDPERNRKIMNQIELAAREHEATVVFACTLDHVFALDILCRGRGVDSRLIVGATEQAERLDILDQFRRKEFFVLLNFNILGKGIDVPKMDKLIITRPFQSAIEYGQILGRALRGPRNGGNERNTVINLKDNIANYPTVNFIYDYFGEPWVPVRRS